MLPLIIDKLTVIGALQLEGAKGVVEAHGGRVEVTSDLNSGTIFTVRLPKDARNLNTTQH